MDERIRTAMNHIAEVFSEHAAAGHEQVYIEDARMVGDVLELTVVEIGDGADLDTYTVRLVAEPAKGSA